jgi:methyl-accepting chemotaxis protein
MVINRLKAFQILVLGVLNILLLLFVNDQVTERVEKIYFELKKQEVENVVKMSKAFINNTINVGVENGISQSELENKVIDYISYSHVEDLYVWANDDLGIARVHIRPEVVGSFQKSYIRHAKALAGKEILFETRDNINPVTDFIERKINGITFIPEWGWIIGYGSYIYQSDVYRMKNEIMMCVALLVLLLDLVALALIFRISIFKPK